VEGFNKDDEEERGECVPLDGSPGDGDGLTRCVVKEDVSVGVGIDPFDCVYGVVGESKVVHNAKKFLVIYHVEGRAKVKVGCVQVLLEEGGILYVVKEVEELPIGALVFSKSLLAGAENMIGF